VWNVLRWRGCHGGPGDLQTCSNTIEPLLPNATSESGQ